METDKTYITYVNNQADLTGKSEEQTGEELFYRYLQGDNYAFERLIELYEDELARFIYIRVGDRYDVKNLTIETFGQLALNGRKFSGKSSLKTYIFTIAKNLALQHIKNQRKNECIPYDDLNELMCAADETPHGFLEREENKEILHAAMSKLKKEHRKVLELIYFDEMSYRQAAIAMNKSENQVKQMIYRAKLSLQKVLSMPVPSS